MGCKTNTFGTPGVSEREGQEVFFLKNLSHARQIRNRTLGCFERASMPGISGAERDALLSFIVVGGGPTSCEFVTELHDFLRVSFASCLWFFLPVSPLSPNVSRTTLVHFERANSSPSCMTFSG
jgi:NADH dehydrogenase FAD-containing subunit